MGKTSREKVSPVFEIKNGVGFPSVASLLYCSAVVDQEVGYEKSPART